MSNSLTFCTSSSSAAGGRAPAWLNTSLPFLKAISVGMERISAAAASCCSASVSTFAYTTSGCCSDEAANVGANALHGPHHDAQKSTSTISLSVMVSLNCTAVMSLVATSLLTLRSTSLFPVCGSLQTTGRSRPLGQFPATTLEEIGDPQGECIGIVCGVQWVQRAERGIPERPARLLQGLPRPDI